MPATASPPAVNVADATIIVRQSRRKAAILLLTCATFTAIGVGMTRDASANFAGWYCAIFFGICTVVALAQVMLSGRLMLSPAGITLVHLGRSRSWAWADVSGFRVWNGFSNRLVTFDDFTAPPGMLRKLNDGLGAGASSLPPSWTMAPEALADLLEACKRRWS